MNALQTTSPVEYSDWDDLLLTNSQADFFHTSAWAKVLSETYRYTPLYFTKEENGSLASLIPLMEVDSFITGRRGISLPFTDYVPIITDKNYDKDVYKEYLIRFGKKAKWKHFELRGDLKGFEEKTAFSSFINHYLELSKDQNEIFKSFKSSNRRNINKAIKEGINIDNKNIFQSVKEFYRLNCITRKTHGLPPQPWSFFKKIFEHIISKGKGFVVLASYENMVIAGAMYFLFKDKVIYKYGASDRRYQSFRANNLVMWNAIKWSCQNGFKKFCFGRTEQNNTGLLQFKRGWGAKEKPIRYYRYDLIKDSMVTKSGKIKSSYKVFEKMPLLLLRIAGILLYRHVG